jgi:predicted dehydrogenase
MTDKVKVLIVGLGNMGISHAKAYHHLDGFEIAGLCSRGTSKLRDMPDFLQSYDHYTDYEKALSDLKPDAVSINTWPDTHADYAIKAFDAGAHVFIEKPIGVTVDEASNVVAKARATNRKLVVGYILRHHPSWTTLVDLSRSLGKPLVMRMNLNQQSSGETWNVHKQLMQSISPIVDCGVHYVDMMCLMARSRPVAVHGMGARLSDEVGPDMYNYGHLQVLFEDGSVGWYEAGWGPMMSETAFFVKDVIGPKGSVSIVAADEPDSGHASDDVDAHTKTNALRFHHAELGDDGTFKKADEIINTEDEPGHDELCQREQEYFLSAIQNDIDLTEHMEDAINSLKIVLAADESFRTGKRVEL